MAGKLGQPQYLIWERPEYRSPSPDHHGCGDVLYPDAPYRSLELPLKSSRLQVHGCFLDGSAICNKMNAQYVPVGRGLGLYSLFLDMKNTLRVFRVLFFTLSTLGVAYQTPHQSAVSAVQWAERCAAFPDKECRTADCKGRREASFKLLRPPQREGTNLRKFLPPLLTMPWMACILCIVNSVHVEVIR